MIRERLEKEYRLTGRIYLFLLFFMGLTGFAQMPIFKRYYIADIPGLGWLAQFYTTHILHYLGAISLLALIFYAIAMYGLAGKALFRLTVSAYVRIFFLAGLVVTGIFRVLKNLPDVLFSPGFTMFIDISHLVITMLLFLFGAFFFIRGSSWNLPIDGGPEP